MPTKRGWAAFAAGLFLWVASRFMGSPDLHMVAVGLVALPFLAVAFVRWRRVSVDAHRNLSLARVYPRSRVTVSLRVENRSRVTLPFLLLQDAVPPNLGKPARLVITGIPPRNAQTVSYSIVCRHRGRYALGPLTVYFADPFGLARVPITSSTTTELVVYPEVEKIEPWKLGVQGAGAGESAARHLHRSAAEFYTMREYVTGDDLRRIHWPSVARTGRLMIRQDEATRRSAATLFLDNRSGALGANGSPAFERAVSVTASLGRMLMTSGFAVRLAMLDAPTRPVSEESLLEVLASTSPVRTRGLGEALTRLRATSRPDAGLALVAAIPQATELAAMLRAGSPFGKKLAVFVYSHDPSALRPESAAESEGRASAARLSLVRAGWEVYLVKPDGRLNDVWQPRRSRLQVAGLPS
jgi:uncharacterized protein (DUF58 family)